MPHIIPALPVSSRVVTIEHHPYTWDYAGTTGTFVASEQVLFVTLSATGPQRIPINLRHW